MHRIIVFFAAAVLLLTVSLPTAAAQDIPSDVYQWVQSSPRIGYYFNKAEMKYAIGSDGWADTNVLEVPVLQQYDWIEIQDVTEKRRWNDGDISEFNNLWGFAGVVHIDLNARTVTYVQAEYLDIWWSPLATVAEDNVDSLDKMSNKNLDKIFYDTIIDYATTHKAELMQRQHDQIKPEELKAAGIAANKKPAPAVVEKTTKEKVKEIIAAYGNGK